MSYDVINLKDKLEFVNQHWAPKIIAQMNDYHFKLVKLQGEFVGCFECHIKPNIILVYKKNRGLGRYELLRIGSHSEIFK